MKRGFALFIFFIWLCQNYSFCQSSEYTWDEFPDQPFLGHHIWSNSFNDWRIDSGRVVGQPYFGNKRTATFTNLFLSAKNTNWAFETQVGFIDTTHSSKYEKAGFWIGIGDEKLPNQTRTLIHNNTPLNGGILFQINPKGGIELFDPLNHQVFWNYQLPKDSLYHLFSDGIHLRLEQNKQGLCISIDLKFGVVYQDTIKSQLTSGGVALYYDTPKKKIPFCWFDNVKYEGFEQPEQGIVGPLLSSFYFINQDSIFLNVQAMPFQKTTQDSVFLQFGDKRIVYQSYDILTHQFSWRLPNLLSANCGYEILYKGLQSKAIQKLKGRFSVVKKPQDQITIQTLSCNGFPHIHSFPYNYEHLWYAYDQIEKGYHKFNPDLLVFLGDQIYESRPNAPVYEPEYNQLDYLYKWAIWNYAFRNEIAQTPCIILTDDHDVYQGNLWGNGKTTKLFNGEIPKHYGSSFDTYTQDQGGFFMDSVFLKLVYKTQTSHLPQPYKSNTMGVPNYYTTLSFYGLDIAILEDKKFKTPPARLGIPIFNGFALDQTIEPNAYLLDSATLLGNNQIEMLKNWKLDSNRFQLVLTQSPFGSITTMDSAFNPLLDHPAFPSNKHKVSPDMDTNGWPKSGRDSAVNLLCNIADLVVAADQHLGSISWQVSTSGDSLPTFTSPAIANTWPRYYFAPTDSLIHDAFGNPMIVHKVYNPNPFAPSPYHINRKGPGFGIITISPRNKKAQLLLVPLYFDQLKKKDSQKLNTVIFWK